MDIPAKAYVLCFYSFNKHLAACSTCNHPGLPVKSTVYYPYYLHGQEVIWQIRNEKKIKEQLLNNKTIPIMKAVSPALYCPSINLVSSFPCDVHHILFYNGLCQKIATFLFSRSGKHFTKLSKKKLDEKWLKIKLPHYIANQTRSFINHGKYWKGKKTIKFSINNL
jgi:hypothetical protein